MLNPAAIFKCLADETRARATLLITREGELCVCELVCALDESQPKISRHLAQLRSCGLLLDRRQGQWVYYRLNPELPAWVREVLETTLTANSEWLASNTRRLSTMDGPPSTQQRAADQRTRRLCSPPPPFFCSPWSWSSGNPEVWASAGVPHWALRWP
ncbi:metalloregulator ArsR/SmtB family transcription factor [Pseudomonas sp. FSL R10-0399]|nr:metalloregulator ArsR/SmtB family transcription factor [Pseudomonas sp. FSL R10-0399]